VATHLRVRGIFSDSVITNFVPILTVKKVKKNCAKFLATLYTAKKATYTGSAATLFTRGG